MMYILTEEEYKELKERPALIRSASDKRLVEFCRMVSNTIPVTKGWKKGHIWGCIIDRDPDETTDWYCDDCPSVNVCPYESKSFSK